MGVVTINAFKKLILEKSSTDGDIILLRAYAILSFQDFELF